ncbi:hypothetical protein Acr_00g0009640 [Actinidia rufa]|uniref:Uncharacterized protein n=1 Tax=Actinidia rufa TaxID=165716 RepID=A0A7J0D8X9_9ERIC|nr:hypothetical protein Acr_00g0009640 [Actinidia rufa]
MGLSEEASTCKLPFVPCHPLGSPPTVASCPSSGTIISPNFLNSNSSKVTVALAWTVPVFSSVCTEHPESVLEREGARYLTAAFCCVDTNSDPTFTLRQRFLVSNPSLSGLPYGIIGLRVLSPRPFCCQDRFKNMELNRAQLLVHNNAALNKFRTDHDIPEDVQIEHHRPNEDANLVEGNGDRIPIQTWLIHQAGLRFSISLMLKEVMERCHLTFMQVSVNFVQAVLAVDTLMCQMKLPFSASDLACLHCGAAKEGAGHTLLEGCLENGSSELGTMVTGRSQGTMVVCLSVNFNEIFKHRSDDCKAAIQSVNNRKASRKVTDLLAYEPIYRHVIPHKVEELSRIRLPALRTEGQAPHCGEFNSEGSGTELNEEAPVARVRGYEEGITSSFSSYTSSDSSDNKEEEEVISQLAGVEPSSMEAPLLNKRKGKQLAGDPSKKGKKRRARRAPPYSPPPLFKPSYGSPSSPLLSLANRELGRNQGIANDATSSGKRFDLCLQRATAISDRMKQQSAELKKTKKKVGSLEYELNKAKLSLASIDQLKLDILEDNPAWAKAAPEVELPESPESYSPMILPGFNEEEYMNQPAEEAPADEATEHTGEAAAEEAREDAAQDQAGEDAAQDPPPKL